MTELSSLVVCTNLWKIKDQLRSNKQERFCGRRLNGDFKLSRTINPDDSQVADVPEVEGGLLMNQIVTSERFPAEDAAADLQPNLHTSPIITGAGCLYVRSYVHILSQRHHGDTILQVAEPHLRCLISNHERNLLHQAHGDNFFWPAERLLCTFTSVHQWHGWHVWMGQGLSGTFHVDRKDSSQR